MHESFSNYFWYIKKLLKAPKELIYCCTKNKVQISKNLGSYTCAHKKEYNIERNKIDVEYTSISYETCFG
jgi:hypothetical protein